MKIQLLAISLIFLTAVFLFTFNILGNPPGIETDEGVIAHNAALIAKTWRDQNNRFLPFFVLSSDKMDWKQPVIIYASVIFFKLFGTSLLVFKFVNICISLTTLLLLYILLKILFKGSLPLAGLLVYITTPMVIIATRMGNEGIDPVLFATLWLLSLVLFRKDRKPVYLILAAVALGIGFYSYKGMRLIFPVWTVLTLFYISWRNVINRKLIINLCIFGVTLLPFVGIIPLLEQKYPGSVFDRREISFGSYRHAAYYWFSNLSPSLLFVEGDVGRIFSVEQFGMFMLASLPIFIAGVLKAIKEKNFMTFVLIIYISTPILFGMAGSLGYGHRLVAMVPAYVILTTLGFRSLGDLFKKSLKSKLIVLAIAGFYLLNIFDFFSYYYFKYPHLSSTRESFKNNFNNAFFQLSRQAKLYNFVPYVQNEVYYAHGEGTQFFEVAYFDKPLNIWVLGTPLPKNSVLLTANEKISGFETLAVDVQPLHILLK